MLKNDVAVVGAGLGGATVAYGLQQKNYRAYLINGSSKITGQFRMQKMFLY